MILRGQGPDIYRPSSAIALRVRECREDIVHERVSSLIMALAHSQAVAPGQLVAGPHAAAHESSGTGSSASSRSRNNPSITSCPSASASNARCFPRRPLKRRSVFSIGSMPCSRNVTVCASVMASRSQMSVIPVHVLEPFGCALQSCCPTGRSPRCRAGGADGRRPARRAASGSPPSSETPCTAR